MRFLFLLLISVAIAGVAKGETLKSVSLGVAEGAEESGFGLPFVGPSGCTFLTAEHVTRGFQAMHWISSAYDLGGSSRPARVQTGYPGTADGNDDLAIVLPAVGPANCAIFPDASAVRRAGRVGSIGEIVLAGKRSIPVRVERANDKSFNIVAVDEQRPILVGYSGAPIWVDDVPIGILRAVHNSGEGDVLPLDVAAVTATRTYIDPGRRSALGDAALAISREAVGYSADSYWEAFGYEIVGAPQSARARLEAASALGSSAALSDLAELLWSGEGGARDEPRAARLRDVSIERLLDAASQRGEPDAVFALLRLNALGRLAEGDITRALPAVQRVYQRLLLRRRAGELEPSRWLAAMNYADQTSLEESFKSFRASRLGKVYASSSSPPLLGGCSSNTCVRLRLSLAYECALEAARSGDALSIILANELAEVRTFPIAVSREQRLKKLDCAAFRKKGGTVVEATAFISCKELQSRLSIASLQGNAFERILAWSDVEAALKAGSVMVATKWNGAGSLVPEQQLAVQNAMRFASEFEGSLEALYQRGAASYRWSGFPRDWPVAVRSLEEYVARAPPGGENVGSSLAILARIYSVGGFGSKPDDASYARVVSALRQLNSDQAWMAGVTLGGFSASDPEGQKLDLRKNDELGNEMILSAARRGNRSALSSIVSDNKLFYNLNQAEVGTFEHQLSALDESQSVADRCSRLSAAARTASARKSALYSCAQAVSLGRTSASFDAVSMFSSAPREFRVAERWLSEDVDRRTGGAVAELTNIKLKAGVISPDQAAQEFREQAGGLSTRAQIALVELMIKGRVPWDAEKLSMYLQAAAYSGVNFRCLATKGASECNAVTWFDPETNQIDILSVVLPLNKGLHDDEVSKETFAELVAVLDSSSLLRLAAPKPSTTLPSR